MLRAKLSDIGVAHTPSSTGRGRDSKSLGYVSAESRRDEHVSQISLFIDYGSHQSSERIPQPPILTPARMSSLSGLSYGLSGTEPRSFPLSDGFLTLACRTKNVTLTQLKRALPLSDSDRPSIPKVRQYAHMEK